jgi:Ca-activated chloride channel family protein
MQRGFLGLLVVLACAAHAPAAGLLIPKDSDAPLAMVNHHVKVTIDEQVAITRVDQTFRNHTSRQLEATYVFPVPKGASVTRFAMWVNGKEVKGELVEAEKARTIYTDIVRRIQDPGLLEYMGNNLLKLRVFPIPPHGDQKVSLSFSAVNERDAGLVQYTYPLKTNDKAAQTLEKFSLDVTIKSQHAVQNVYSPTHPVTIEHKGDRVATAHFERKEALLDKDFQLFYALGDKDVGLTALMYRPDAEAPGQFLLLISPRAELAKMQQVPRDVVLVLDTSGSMSGPKIEQARRALKFCLDRLTERDNFAVLNFATTVSRFADGLLPVNKSNIARARKWVDDLEATGGTAIDDALKAALALRSNNTDRSFTVVFFTDGEPTVGETNPEKIVKNVTDNNSSHTRIFTFGVGDDVNATLLDRLADATRAVSTYVRPEEDIEVKVSGLYAKISHPVLTDLRVSSGNGLELSEMYPNKLPDLFHGGQVVVLGRFKGHGHKAIKLTGKVGNQTREFVYEVNFPTRTGPEKSFVAELWARRKVGYLLDEVRRNGERKELVEEVVKLAKKHGITTPYTSYLVVPDNVTRAPVVGGPGVVPLAPSSAPAVRGFTFTNTPMPRSEAPANGQINYAPAFVTPATTAAAVPGPAGAAPPSAPTASYEIQVLPPGAERASRVQKDATLRARIKADGAKAEEEEEEEEAEPRSTAGSAKMAEAANYARYRNALANGNANCGKLGVDLAIELNNMRNQNQLGAVAAREANGRTCRNIAGAWVDEGFDAKMKIVRVKAMSKAYFRLLEKQPALKEVFQLGTRILWVAPNGNALVIEPNSGKKTMTDAEIDALFVKK